MAHPWPYLKKSCRLEVRITQEERKKLDSYMRRHRIDNLSIIIRSFINRHLQDHDLTPEDSKFIDYDDA